MSAASTITVEQLSHAQWHVLIPLDRATGVINYVEALTYALIVGSLEGFEVETVALDGTRLVLMREGVRHG